jgi:hypothetical protein
MVGMATLARRLADGSEHRRVLAVKRRPQMNARARHPSGNKPLLLAMHQVERIFGCLLEPLRCGDVAAASAAALDDPGHRAIQQRGDDRIQSLGGRGERLAASRARFNVYAA